MSFQNETLLYQPTPPGHDALRVGWVYPYTYAVSMSSLGYLTLFKTLDQRSDVAVQRVNTDNMTHYSASDFDVMGLSFSYELDILEILTMLDHFQLPLYTRDRDENMPLIFAGGPVPTTNPEPYADFFDFLLIGEGEGALEQLVALIREAGPTLSRYDLLVRLAQEVPGVYVPSLYDVTYTDSGEIRTIEPVVANLPSPIEPNRASDLNDWVTTSPILTEDTVFSNTFLVEVMRGCSHRCRFCLASYSALPARGPQLDTLKQRIEMGLQHTHKIGLLGALIADHPQFEELCDFLNTKEGIRVSSASLRADTLTPHVAHTFFKGGARTVTIAVETGSERLRKRINKHLKTEAIEQAAQHVAEAGIPNLKLYFMAGLPDEEDCDLEDTIALMRHIKKANPQLKLQMGCSTFVPKAQTPFQWLSREASSTLKHKHERLRKALVGVCQFRPSSPKWDYVQAVISRGDRRLAPFLETFWREGGNLGAVNRAMKTLHSSGGSVDFPSLDWYALRKRSPDEILPWDHISLGVSKQMLYRESGLEAGPIAAVR